MSQPFVGEIIAAGFNFPPQGWALCDGQEIPIAENDVLYQLIGTTYGGDGETTFRLPDLRGRAPLHMGTGPTGTSYIQGEFGGTETEGLTVGQLPAHAHDVAAARSFTSPTPADSVPAPGSTYGDPGHVLMHPQMIGVTGGGQPHENMPPFLTLNWCISLFGVFPQQN